MDALERVACYVGYCRRSPFISDFWDIVREYSSVRKRQLLEFVTASDRLPVGGAAGVEFVVQRNGGDDEVRLCCILPFKCGYLVKPYGPLRFLVLSANNVMLAATSNKCNVYQDITAAGVQR